MPFATSNRTALRAIAEVTNYITPATPAFVEVRFDSESLDYNLSFIKSKEIRSDRMTSDLVQTKSDAGGEIKGELSYATYDRFIESAMAAALSADLAVASSLISVTGANQFNGTGIGTNVVVGQWIRVKGFANAANNGYHRCTARAAGTITVASTLVNEATGPAVTINGQMVRNGVTLNTMTLQKYLADATTPAFLNFRGSVVDTFALDLKVGEFAMVTFNMMSIGATISNSGVAGQTIVAANTNEVMNCVGMVAQILENGVLSTVSFKELSFNLKNNVRAQDAIGSLDHIAFALGSLEITGKASVYFVDKVLYDRFVSATAFSLAVRLQDSAGNSYVFTMPAVKFETGELDAGGLDQDVMFNGNFRAIRDSATNCMFQIDKLPA